MAPIKVPESAAKPNSQLTDKVAIPPHTQPPTINLLNQQHIKQDLSAETATKETPPHTRPLPAFIPHPTQDLPTPLDKVDQESQEE